MCHMSLATSLANASVSLVTAHYLANGQAGKERASSYIREAERDTERNEKTVNAAI